MSEVQHWEVNQTFIDTCNENVELIRSAYKKREPTKLKSFINFKNYEDEWWDRFYREIPSDSLKRHWLNRGMIKFNYTKDMNIPILNDLSEHLFSKVFNDHTVVCWVSLNEEDTGTNWHKDFQPNTSIPTYLICMNLIGQTNWQFESSEDIDMQVGDVIAQNGSMPHKIIAKGMRITLAGHSSLHNVKL